MINIAIDGVAGCGKSTLAEQLSKKLNIKKFNTGMVYRAITCEYIKQFSKDVKPTKNIIDKFLQNLDVEVKFVDNKQFVLVNGNDYSNVLRQEIVSNFTPFISGYDCVRERVRKIQREFASCNDCIVEGRDIGRVVLKDATIKLFLTASDEVRAQRRFEQISMSPNAPTFEQVLQDIKARDKEDRIREFGAMIPADDAIIVDNSNQTLEQTLDFCLELINKNTNKK